MKSLVFFVVMLIYSKCSYLRRDNRNILNQNIDTDTIDSLKEVISTLVNKLDSIDEESHGPHVKYCITA